MIYVASPDETTERADSGVHAWRMARQLGAVAHRSCRRAPGEREYVRRGLDMFFSTYPSVAEGFHLKTWRAGPQAGQPKTPPTAKGLLERGLMRLNTSNRLPRLFFTDAGLAELWAMLSDRRLADPVKFAHVRQELGIDPPITPVDAGT
jgi:hypothetical protein